MQSYHTHKKRGRARSYSPVVGVGGKKSEYTLGDVGESLEHLRWLEAGPWQGTCLHADEAKSLLAWSPPEDWMTRLTPPYNESTNHV
jgi:hypothetical protein